MLKKNHKFIALSIAIIDLILTFFAFYSSYKLRFHSEIFQEILNLAPGEPIESDFFNLRFFLAITFIWPLVFMINRMYRTKRGSPLIDLVLSVISSATLSLTLLLVTTFFFMRPVREGVTVTYSRAMILTFWILDILYILAFRLVIRLLSRYLRKRGFNQRHILIIGAGELGQLLVKKVRQNPEMGLRAEGFVDDDPEKQWAVIDGIPVLGAIDDAPEIIRSRGIEQVFTALPLSAHRKLYHILGQIQNECVDIKIIPDILEYITLRAGFQNMDGIPVINLTETPLSGYNLFVKRIIDLFLAAILLVLFSPVMIILAALIKITSPGKILYRQKRMGVDLRPFEIYKFRSMRINHEGLNGTGWTITNDPRITRLGRFMRRWNLDELPQLFNVIKGNMSLVGPRPEQPAFVEEFRNKYPRYMIRHKVKSGMTGWAQVNGYRGDTSIKKRLEYDMYYIENWSVSLDLKIMIMTINQTFKNFIRPQSSLQNF
ncbi:undecaprenyl-phosphate glucose phosphotransferase [bacterium]|nr:undecaprenyl-phosphate glucose phosphotransferase [candidate division CSSED10-310 bacterium]